MRLAGKKVIVVGAGQTPGQQIGNGRAVAELMAREGATLFLVDKSAERLAETEAVIRRAGGTATSLALDITSEESCRQLAEEASKRLGDIDILHNNAGIMNYADEISMSLEDWRSVMDVNLTGMWLTCKHVLPFMRARRSGAIINISSIAALYGTHAAYCASKAAVNSLTQILATNNAAFQIRVNAIMPGLIDTPWAVGAAADGLQKSREEVTAARHQRVPLGHMGTAWDVAKTAVFLASDDAAYITGVAIPVDGGLSAAPPRQ